MHVTVGRWIWQHGGPPWVNVFSYVTAGQEFIAHSWLAELVFYLIEQTAGTVGFMALHLALISLALTFALAVARSLKAPWPALMLLAPVVLRSMWGRLEFRPQLFTTALLALELWLLISVHTGRRSWRWVWALPPVYALWINLHGGWPQGLLTLVAMMGALGVMSVRPNLAEALDATNLPLRHLALVFVACLAALFLNPYGARLVYFPLEMQASWIRAQGTEWRSPVALLWRVRGVQALVLISYLAYLALLGGVIYQTGKRWRTADLVPIAVMGLWLALTL